jgi:hypothetical protein
MKIQGYKSPLAPEKNNKRSSIMDENLRKFASFL